MTVFPVLRGMGEIPGIQVYSRGMQQKVMTIS